MAMILLRKSLWDTVHRNLLDLEDNFNGKVIRNGFAARPVFKGQIHDSDITINFSSAKTPSGRKTYIDFTLTTASRLSVTIAEKNWLTEQNHENSSDKEEINLKNNTSYLVMSSDSTKIKHIITKNDFKQALEQIENMAYFFVGKTGTICEFWSEQVDRDTEITKMKTRLENVYRLLAFIQ
jgi:hypothetical protein